MDRRQYLKAAGGVGVAGVGGYGLYTAVFREPDWEPDDDGASAEQWNGPVDAESRDGWLLLGLAPSSRGARAVEPMEEWLGKRNAVVGTFADVGNSEREIRRIVFSLLEATWQRGQVPHLWWQPFVPDRESASGSVNAEIAAGEHDDLLETWAETLAEWALVEDGPDRRLYLNLAPEMNGDWYPWSAGGNEETFVEAWRRVHGIVTEAGLGPEQVQWIWTLDTTNEGADRAALYPGDEYVDWAGIHGFNWTEWADWQSPRELFGETVDAIRDVTDRPIAVTEVGTSPRTADGGRDSERKNQWIADAYEYFREADVRMTLWFDATKETDWAVFDAEHGVTTASVDGREYGVYPAYREAVRDEGVLGPHPDHPRVLTDDEFSGEF